MSDDLFPPGHIHTCYDSDTGNTAQIMHNGTGIYTIHHGNGQVYTTSDTSTINAIMNGCSFSSAGLFVSTITPEEEKELEQLEQEMATWKRLQELLEFQKLHVDLRQDIVNEALARDAYIKMQNVEDSKFDHYQRIQELKHKKQPGQIMFNAHYVEPFRGSTWRYHEILGKFTTDELIEAHGAATFEEQLHDDKEEGGKEENS